MHKKIGFRLFALAALIAVNLTMLGSRTLAAEDPILGQCEFHGSFCTCTTWVTEINCVWGEPACPNHWLCDFN